MRFRLPKYLQLFCLLFAGAAIADDRPDWLSGEPDKYPNAQYVYATGSSSRVETARDRALGNLAKVFELHIRESSTTSSDVESFRSGGVETVKKSARIASQVNISTDKMIQGARIAEVWLNEADLTNHALAVLDRAQAGNNIRSELNKLDRDIAFIMNQAENRDNPLQRVDDLRSALEKQTEREALQSTLKIIDLQGRGKPSSWSTTELAESLNRALKSLQISGTVTMDDVGELEKILHGAMAHAGFVHDARGGYTLNASMETQEPLRRSGWYWLRGTLTLRMSAADGTVMGHKSWPLKVSAQSTEQLDDRMRQRIDKKLKAELMPTVLGFASGDR